MQTWTWVAVMALALNFFALNLVAWRLWLRYLALRDQLKEMERRVDRPRSDDSTRRGPVN